MPGATVEYKWRPRVAFNAMYVGQTFTFRRVVTHGDLVLFCGVTGDYNPYHQDEAFPAKAKCPPFSIFN